MKLFIKDRLTFETKAAVDIYNYTLVQSIYTDLSDITTAYTENINDDDIIFTLDGFIALVNDSEREGDNVLHITAKDISYLFNNKQLYDGDAENYTAETYLYNNILSEYVNQTDSFYQLTYLNLTKLTSTSVSTPTLEEGLWTVKSFISQIRRLYNIFVNYTVKTDKLDITIGKEVRATKTLVTTNRPVDVLEETFSSSTVAKITAYNRSTTPVSTTNYYLLSDGSFTTNAAADDRVSGDWEWLEIMSGEDEQERVLNKFKENSYSHKVSLLMPDNEARFDFYDPITLELRNHYYTTYISKKIRHDDGTVEYQCGELRTTLTDKINQQL